MEKLINQINKKYRTVVVRKANEAVSLNVPRLTTGFFELDKCLGGGFPFSRIHLIYGPPASLKTTLLLKIVASAQRHCRYCGRRFRVYKDGSYGCEKCQSNEGLRTLWIDSEGSFDNNWAEAMGVNLEDVWVAQVEYGEEAIDIGKLALYDESIDLLVLDSIASLTPVVEIEESSEKQIYSPGAKIINKAMRVWNSAVLARGMDKAMRPTIFLVNQTRVDVTKIWGNKEKLPYGEAQNFMASTKVRMNSIPESSYVKKDSTEVTYVEGSFKVMKNKSYVPFQEGSFRLYVRNTDTYRVGDTDDFERVFKYARQLDIIRKEGNMYIYKEHRFNRLEDLRMVFIRYERFQELRQEVLEKCVGLKTKT